MKDEVVVVTFKAPKESLEAWKKIAEHRGDTLADWIRTCLNTEVTKVNLEEAVQKNKVSIKVKTDRLVEVVQPDKTVLFSIEYRPSSLLGHSRFIVRSTPETILLQGPFDFGTWNPQEMQKLSKKIVRHLLPDIDFN